MGNYPARYQLQYQDPGADHWRKFGAGANDQAAIVTRCQRMRERAARRETGHVYRVWDRIAGVEIPVEASA